MSVTSELPPPSGFRADWKPISVKAVAGLLMFASFGAFFGFLSLRAIVESRWPYLLFYVPCTVVFLVPALGVLVKQSLGDVPTMQEFRAEHGGGEFRLQRSFAQAAAIVAVATIAAVGCATFSIGVLSGSLEFELTNRQRGSFPIMIAMLGVVAAWLAVGTVVRGSSGWLVLTPWGIDSMEWGMPRRRIEWNELRDMTLEPQEKKKRQPNYSPKRVWLIRADPAERPISISLDWPMGNRAAFWLLHFYLTHPDLRDELGDDRVVERITIGRILDDVA